MMRLLALVDRGTGDSGVGGPMSEEVRLSGLDRTSAESTEASTGAGLMRRLVVCDDDDDVFKGEGAGRGGDGVGI